MARCVVSLRHWATVIRDFASSEQLLHLSAALVISDAFTKMVVALLNNLLTPAIGFLLNEINIAELTTTLKAARQAHKAPVILPYGKFLQELISFVVISLILSVLIMIANKIHRAKQRTQINPQPLPTKQESILMEHTNLLRVIVKSLKK